MISIKLKNAVICPSHMGSNSRPLGIAESQMLEVGPIKGKEGKGNGGGGGWLVRCFYFINKLFSHRKLFSWKLCLFQCYNVRIRWKGDATSFSLSRQLFSYILLKDN